MSSQGFMVLVPGLDGTGRLFEPLLEHYPGPHQLIQLPIDCAQDYDTLAQSIAPLLPDHPFTLLVESFSGGLARPLAKLTGERIQQIIFVAGFLSPPHPLLLKIAQRLPLKVLAKLPLSSLMIRQLCLGKNASDREIVLFKQTIESVPTKILRQRIQVIANLDYQGAPILQPSTYIQATQDKLVSADQIALFQQTCQHLNLYQIDGPHFILQAEPQISANIIAHIAGDTSVSC